ncbi:MAG TPA: hypothetical protein VF281_01575 [Candidatus Saccharimonadales bacterium]
MVQYPGINAGFVENHESIIYFDRNGKRIEKSHLLTKTKIERENLLAWQFIRHINQIYDKIFPPYWCARDAPHDFTFQEYSGLSLEIEIVSMGNYSSGSVGGILARKIQGIKSQIQESLEQVGAERGHFIVFHAHVSKQAMAKLRRRLADDQIPVMSQPPSGQTLKRLIGEVTNEDKVLVYRMEGSSAPNIFQYDSGIDSRVPPYGYLVERAVKLKQKKHYKNESSMTLLIDDRTTRYEKTDVIAFSQSIAMRRIARQAKFDGIFIIISHGGGYMARNSDYHIVAVKEPNSLM